MSKWHLQLWDTEWVFWGYGPEAKSVVHISPALYKFDAGDGDLIEIPFKLKQREGSSLPPAQEYRREKKVGWRFKTNDLMHDTDWRVADTKEQALKDANDLAQEKGKLFEEACKDVREMKDVADWLGSVL